jgi:hypothetical protein
MSDMTRILNKNLLKYAVQRSIFNSDGTVADVRRSVLVEVFVPSGDASVADKHGMTLYSGKDFDMLPSLADTVAALPVGSVIEVWDGRYLFGSGRSHDGYLRYANETVPATSTDATQEILFS